ncbi:hypothetical protein CEY16_03145 [Halalkalibacillus sediminis]|uniref:Uncharacterized protein n=1 Tax=Halalkalibacillus sediminis TaxID=2018042 RepID=A0A2I0QWP5_9BACI|nr:hypothetical protein [Halalkalibacillus sediminis]PKR78767.1 hypothetical protein CEY16_03145 [Halalkalibacillus sediminis]
MSENKVETSSMEESVARFYSLKQEKKAIDEQLKELRKEIVAFLDDQKGENTECRQQIGEYQVRRQIRKQEKFDDEATVERLKDLGLEEFIEVVEAPDIDKIKSALELSFIKSEDLDQCLFTKFTPIISVDKK